MSEAPSPGLQRFLVAVSDALRRGDLAGAMTLSDQAVTLGARHFPTDDEGNLIKGDARHCLRFGGTNPGPSPCLLGWPVPWIRSPCAVRASTI